MHLDIILIPKNDRIENDINYIGSLIENHPIINKIKQQSLKNSIIVDVHLNLINNNIELKLDVIGDEENYIFITSELKNLLNDSELSDKFKFLYAYDSLSDYYAKTLYPYLITIERKLRNLIYIVAKDYEDGRLFELIEKIDENLPNYESVVNNIYRTSKDKSHKVNALDYIYFSDYKKILFTPFITSEGDELRNFWDKFIGVGDCLEIKYSLESIESLRNSVMHGKEISTPEYECGMQFIEIVNNNISLSESVVFNSNLEFEETEEMKGMKYKFFIRNIDEELIPCSFRRKIKLNNSNF